MKIEKKYPPIDTNILSEFNFGDPEAKSDDMLMHCFQNVRGVNEFLTGTKSIVLGERGAGKSALFKQLVNGNLSFSKDGKEKHRKTIVIPIDEDIEYLSIANIIEVRFADQTYQKYGKYRFLWEIYILSRVIESLSNEYSDDLEITVIRDDFAAILGLPKEKGFKLRDLFTAYKITFGAKVDQVGSVTPSLSVEPAKESKSDQISVTDHEIATFRERIRKALRSKNTIAIALVDRVDDFVVGIAYEEQLKNIQALVECIQNFRLPELKLKVFLRTDLFNRINFQHGGFDKIAPQIVKLEWTSKDICEFVARRLAHNYARLGLKIHHDDMDLSLLDIDPIFTEQLKDIFKREIKDFKALSKAIYDLLILNTKIRWAKFRRKSHTARQTDLLHAIIVRIITHIFPAKVIHYNSQGQKDEISIESYFFSHFNFGAETPNPRLVLLFLIFTFEETSYYYSRNPDKNLIEANDFNEYELILKENILNGYKKLQLTVRQTVAHLNSAHRNHIERMFISLKKPSDSSKMSLNRIKEITNWGQGEEEFFGFVKLFTHIGLFKTDDPTIQFEKRTFSFPTVIKMCNT